MNDALVQIPVQWVPREMFELMGKEIINFF